MIQFSVETKPSVRKIKNKFFIASTLLTVLILSFLINPHEFGFSTCLFHRITGYDCPTCGLSRSFYATSHLHLEEAFNFHLLGPICFCILLVIFLKFSIEVFFKKDIQIKVNPILLKLSLLTFFGVWICFWIIRLF